jgi:hypothetical protein
MGQTDASGCRLGSSSLRGRSTSLSLERNQAPATLARVQWRAARTQSAEPCRGRAISSVQRTHVDVEVIPKESSKRALVDIPTNSRRKHSKSNSARVRKRVLVWGTKGSQVRVLSPRFAAECTAVQPFPLSCSRFQLAGISHFAGTSTHSLIDVLSCKTTLFAPPSAGR